MGEETGITLASMEFNTLALEQKAVKEAGLQKWMEGSLNQGVDKDWEYSHIIWKRDPPEDRAGKTLPKSEWSPQLLDPGTAKIMGYMGVRPNHVDIKVEFDDETGQGRAQMKSQLVTILPILYLNIKTGEPVPYHPVIAEGVGSCTNKEKRFRVKWENYTGRALIADGGYTVKDLEDLKKMNPDRLIRDNEDIKKAIFFMPDPAAAGADNSLLKMAAKRSECDAVFQIPGVAQRFSQELDITKTELDESGNRAPIPVQSKEEPQEEDWSDEREGKIKAMGKSPTWIRSQVDDIIAKSDGLVTTKKAALSVLLKRLKKKEKPKKPAPTPKPKPEPKPEKEHDIPNDCLELAQQISDAAGVSLGTISDMMEEEITKAGGSMSSEAALHLVNKILLEAAPIEEEPSKAVSDFMKPAKLQVPEWMLADELNREKDSWKQAKKITESWMKTAGFNLDEWSIKVDKVKIAVTPKKSVPQEAVPDINRVMFAAGFSKSQGVWRLNRADVVG